jgi:hypothetical protein
MNVNQFRVDKEAQGFLHPGSRKGGSTADGEMNGYRRLVPHAAEGGQLAEGLPDGQLDFVPFVGGEGDTADEASKLFLLADVDRGCLNLMVRNEDGLLTPVVPVGRQRVGWTVLLPGAHWPVKDVAWQGQGEMTGTLFEGGGQEEVEGHF